MRYNVDFHYVFDTEVCEYGTKAICDAEEISENLPFTKLWYRHPDLTLLAIF